MSTSKVLVYAVWAMLVALTGCSTFYVEHGFEHATYRDALPYSTEPIAVRLQCEAHRYGDRKPKWDDELRAEVSDVLDATGVFVAGEAEGLPTLRVVVHRVGDRNDARRARARFHLATVPTAGLIGSHLEQPVDVEVSLVQAGEEVITRNYSHSVHVCAGRHEPPAGTSKVPKYNLMEEMVEDVLLNFLSEYRSVEATKNSR